MFFCQYFSGSNKNAGPKNEGPEKQDRNMQDQQGKAIKRCN